MKRFIFLTLMLAATLTACGTKEKMESVMNKFEFTGAWNLPVVDEDGKYKGFLSKSRVLNTYRQMLVDFSED